MSEPGRIRPAEPEDAAACRAVYAPYVEQTVVSLEEVAPTVAEMRARIAAALQTHAWLVIEHEGRVSGYAYGGPYKSRTSYRWACEVSVYLEQGRHRSGTGRALYAALFARLAERGYLTAVAGMTLPNPASEGLHAVMGFEPVGTWRRIGWKFGAWHDVLWMQAPLGVGTEPPAELR